MVGADLGPRAVAVEKLAGSGPLAPRAARGSALQAVFDRPGELVDVAVLPEGGDEQEHQRVVGVARAAARCGG